MKYVALLRGVNVGGKNKLPMAQLASMFAEAGCTGVVTFIQSGNVVFSAKSMASLGANVCSRIKNDLGFETQIVLRSSLEMAAIALANPFEDIENSHVAFLQSTPGAAQIAALDPNRSLPDQFKVIGREVYLHLPNGAARSKLTNAYFDSRLATVSTIRNWRTVLKLLAMMTG